MTPLQLARACYFADDGGKTYIYYTWIIRLTGEKVLDSQVAIQMLTMMESVVSDQVPHVKQLYPNTSTGKTGTAKKSALTVILNTL